jgi:hypothetical protein
VVCGLWLQEQAKDVCLEDKGLRAQDTLTIIGSIVNIIGGDLYDHIMSTRIFTLVMNKIFI